MRNLILFITLLLISPFLTAQFIRPVFHQPEKVKSLSNNAEETTPILFNSGTEILYHRIYFSETDEDLVAEGKDIWYSRADEKASANISDSVLLRKKWKEPYRLFRDDEVEGVNEVFGISEDGLRVYMINTVFSEDTFSRRVVMLERKEKKGKKKAWDKEYKEIQLPGLVFDDRNIELFLHKSEEIILAGMADSENSQNEDIYISFKQENGSWSKLESLGDQINTKRFELTPFLSEDKKRLYFTSNGYDGYGGGDVYVSTRLDDTWKNWTRPLNLGEPVNSKDFDAYFTISQGNDVYFVSDRESNYYDIFYTRTTGKIDMPQVDSVSALFVYKSLAVSDVEMYVYDADGSLIELVVTDDEGKLNFVKLASDEDYVLKLNAEDNAELIGGALYFLDDTGDKVERLILADDGVFKPAEKIKSREMIQGKLALNQKGVAAQKLVFEDANAFVVDTITTAEDGTFSYSRLSMDSVFALYPNDINEQDYTNYDLYLTDTKGKRIKSFFLGQQMAGDGKIYLKNLPLANQVLKVYDSEGNLIETIITNEDGSFSYHKLGMSEDLVLELVTDDDLQLEGGMVYLENENKQKKRFFITKDKRLVSPDAGGTETLYFTLKKQKLEGNKLALVVTDKNGIPIDTLYADENNLFTYQKMKLDEVYNIRLLDQEELDIQEFGLQMTDATGNKVDREKVEESKTSVAVLKQGRSRSNTTTTSSLNNIYYGFNKVLPLDTETDKLQSLINQVKNNQASVILIGHADGVGTEEVNHGIALQRAARIRELMLAEGIARTRIEVLSKGESLAEGEVYNPENRRVEVIIRN